MAFTENPRLSVSSASTVLARVAGGLTLATFAARIVLDGRAEEVSFFGTVTLAIVTSLACLVRSRDHARATALVGAASGAGYAYVLVYFHSLPEDSAVIPLVEGFVLLLSLVGLVSTVVLLRRPGNH